jgi:hypothetical protein
VLHCSETSAGTQGALSSAVIVALFPTLIRTANLIRITGFRALCPSSGNSKQLEITAFRKLDLFPSSDEGRETRTLLCLVERTNQVKVTLRPTASQSVCLGVKPNMGLLTRDLFFSLFQSYGLVSLVSLTRGRVCHLSVLVNTVYSSQSVIT